MRKVIRKKVTPHLIDNLRVILVKIERVRGAPRQLKSFIKRILKILDDLTKDNNSINRLTTLNLLIEIVIKLILFIQLLK